MVLVQDLLWGMIGPMSFMVDHEVYRMLTLFMLAGMSAGAIVSRGVVFKTYAVSILALLTPIIITLALEGTPIYEGMLALALLYLLFMLSVAKSYGESISKNILLWLDNEKLLGQLRQSHKEIQNTNYDLTREIEQRKKMEVELVEAKERSDRANEAKNQFLANVSHELRTPLNGILGFTSVLGHEKLKAKQKQFVDQIDKSAHSLLRIVNDILDITAIEAGHLKLYEENFSLRTELEEVLTILRPMALRKGLRLEAAVDDEVNDNLCGDPNRLRQIISNLLSNALKYTEEGFVRIHLREVAKRDDRVVLFCDVEDSGVGIAKESLESIFDNFTRVEGFETRHNEGMGLGLAIVRNLLQQMGGRMMVSSEPGEGSCFSFELPFKLGSEPVKGHAKEKTPELDISELQRLNVLVVDDNEVNRMVLDAFLSKAGIPFREADNGHDALKMIRKGDFDVVLMDIQMPDMSGTDVVKQLMDDGQKLPLLIAVTAHAFPEQREGILEAGFSDFLIKPVSEEALLKLLARYYTAGEVNAAEKD